MVQRERAITEQRVQELAQSQERVLATERKRFHEEQERARSRFDGVLEQSRRRHADDMEQQRLQHTKVGHARDCPSVFLLNCHARVHARPGGSQTAPETCETGSLSVARKGRLPTPQFDSILHEYVETSLDMEVFPNFA